MDPDRDNYPYLVFLHFFVQPDEISFSKTYANDPDVDPQSIVPMHSMYHLYFFCYFIAIFHFCTAILSIFGNAPLTLKQDTQHLSSTILFFCFGNSHTVHIWKCTPDPAKHPQHCHQPPPIFSDFFPLFYWYFLYLHSHNFHNWKCNLDTATAPSTLSSTIPYFPPILLPFFSFA
jgi:hypothetical protein